MSPPPAAEARTFRQRFTVARRDAGRRVDQFLAASLDDFSRTFIQGLIRGGRVTVDGEAVKPSHILRRGERVEVAVDLAAGPVVPPQRVPLDVLYEDDDLLVVNKPPDMVVHPVRHRQRGTLVNALVEHTATLSSVGGELRAGIVHRLDRDTSGAIVAAKTDAAHAALAEQFQARSVQKLYLAIVEGEPELDADRIDAPLGRSRRNRQAVCVRPDGKAASTVYRVRARYRGFALLAVELLTGRTHQIRVHLAHIGHPVVADALYGRRHALYRSELAGEQPAEDEEPLIERQALHAHRLAFDHPTTGQRMALEAPLPPDLARLIEALRELRPA
ncbi:MAG: RluA family pseudouridine synthase [Candidatus Brocadiia bacterium]